MPLLEEALSAHECVISIMGAHAGEDANAIFRRKVLDCDIVGRTFWVTKSARARPVHVQALCRKHAGYVLFVEPSVLGGARPTTQASVASQYSGDGVNWVPLPAGLTPVTGKMDRMTSALVFDKLTTNVRGAVDLWAYADRLDPGLPLRFKLGLSTVCAVRSDTSAHSNRMKSRYRGIVAVGHLAEPYCAWVR